MLEQSIEEGTPASAEDSHGDVHAVTRQLLEDANKLIEENRAVQVRCCDKNFQVKATKTPFSIYIGRTNDGG